MDRRKAVMFAAGLGVLTGGAAMAEAANHGQQRHEAKAENKDPFVQMAIDLQKASDVIDKGIEAGNTDSEEYRKAAETFQKSAIDLRKPANVREWIKDPNKSKRDKLLAVAVGTFDRDVSEALKFLKGFNQLPQAEALKLFEQAFPEKSQQQEILNAVAMSKDEDLAWARGKAATTRYAVNP